MAIIDSFTGQFGKVYKAILWNSDGKNIEVALKAAKASTVSEKMNLKKEMAIMSKLMHPNIVQLYGLVQEGIDKLDTLRGNSNRRAYNQDCEVFRSTWITPPQETGTLIVNQLVRDTGSLSQRRS